MYIAYHFYPIFYMRNLLIIPVFCISILVSAQDPASLGQSKFYSRFNLGYSFISGGALNDEITQNTNGTTTVRYTPFSYGKGTNITYGLGYMISPNVGFELGLSYFIGAKNSEKNFYRVDTVSTPYTVDQDLTSKVNLFRVNPSIIISADWKTIIPYVKFGFMMGWGKGFNESMEKAVFQNNPKPSSGLFNWELSGGKAMGFSSALGVNFKSKNQVASFFIELSHINMSGNFKKSTLETANIDGVDLLPNLNTYTKEGVFVDEIEDGAPVNTSEPKKILKHNSSFNSVGFNVGLLIKMRTF